MASRVTQTAKVKFNGKNLAAYFAFAKKMGEKTLKVGILGAKASEKPEEYDGLTIAEIGAVHEFGSPKVHIPERAPIRRTMAKGERKYGTMLKDGIAKALKDQRPLDAVLTVLGELIRGDIVQFIYQGKASPENAESTIRRKGSSVPLVDNGILAGSYGYAIVDKKEAK